MANLLKIQKWGNSQGIRLPLSVLKTIGLDEGDHLEVEVKNKIITMKKYEDKKRKSLYELFEGFEGVQEVKEFDWSDEAFGREEW